MQTNLSNLKQTRLEKLSDYRYRVRIKQNNFIGGIIDLPSKTFINSPRSPKNLFGIFDNSLGISSEIINIICPHFGIEKITIPYQDELLQTTVTKWRQVGICSPFGDDRVDKQILLPLSKINNAPFQVMDCNNGVKQLGLFASS